MKKIHVSAILILLVVMSSCAGLILNFKNSQLMSIQKGMTQQEVKAILGKPNYRRFDEQWKSGNIAGIFPKQGIQ